jgi:hypothetical protein
MQKCSVGDKPSKKKTTQGKYSNDYIMFTQIIHFTKVDSKINSPEQLILMLHNLSKRFPMPFKNSQMLFHKQLKLLIHVDQNRWPVLPNKLPKS